MEEKYQVIVVGGGTSGLMAAIHAAKQGASVLVLEKNPKLGRKLLLSGGGRCNVTNRTTRERLIAHIPGNGKFLYSALNQFDQEDIVAFFQENGVALKEEDHGRMFPVTDSARTILETLLKVCAENGVEIVTNEPVDKLFFDRENQKVLGVLTQSGKKIEANGIILAVGGRAYPRTGATGDGYAWAKAAGHTIERLYPTESPLLSEDKWIMDKSLRGVSLRDVGVSVLDSNNKVITYHQMDMIFTHFGYSGPAILRCSGHVNQWLHQEQQSVAQLQIDLVPALSRQELEAHAESQRDKQIITILKQWMPERMAQVVIQQASLEDTLAYKQLVHAQVDVLWQLVKGFSITSTGSQPIEKGFVTGGGVSTKEVNPATMESKRMSGLYFCGELLDINGYTGGYNITAAFVTGAVAGQHCAWGSFG
ncbi:NAD(P)/FAD-dependent oxidoreductase [Aerococcaceae bacterium zg-ZJ1578]|uniref:NAD(P)/FAD-dependent oxidoreductase n=1 Tax=Aerococcaceae bacterium zg-252 TaxID=2796928 RepID=UPI001A2E3F87|nr:NAD(P)/FAD-dependent oxidoreductase [Aerococcaceae bacterium zg-1578]